MINIGGNIGELYVGSTSIEKAYIGSQLVWEKNSLPYDAEVSYLEGTGTQYIDTGIKIVNGILMEYAGAFAVANTPIVSSNDSAANTVKVQYYNTSYLQVYKGTSNKLTKVNPRLNVIHRITHDSRQSANIFKYDGTQKFSETVATLINSTGTVGIFVSGSSITSGRIRTLVLTDNNDNVVLDWKAVRVGQVGCMYDNLTGELHYNDGTGDFGVGADLT